MASDPLKGLTTKTPKEEWMNVARKLAAQLRRQDKQRQATVAEVQERLIAKRAANPLELKEIVFSLSDAELKDAVEFLEEFPQEDLLPAALQRFVRGGRVFLEHGDGHA